jgi:hypothetical protein
MPATGTEVPGFVGPAAPLHATDRNLDLAPGREEDGRVEDAILLGSHEFFAFEEEDTNIAAVLDQQIGDGATFGYLLNRHGPRLERLVKEQVVHPAVWFGKQRKHRQGLVADGIAHTDSGEGEHEELLLGTRRDDLL